jgi:hypothetical protein
MSQFKGSVNGDFSLPLQMGVESRRFVEPEGQRLVSCHFYQLGIRRFGTVQVLLHESLEVILRCQDLRELMTILTEGKFCFNT